MSLSPSSSPLTCLLASYQVVSLRSRAWKDHPQSQETSLGSTKFNQQACCIPAQEAHALASPAAYTHRLR